ncbi:MAG: 16S rRNA (guanine(966)-N(2))-methyltransferase RsmD [Clostridia bacterium]|nr:16S rRNA (guanine(966)-N(2))-methyltransferase RsmD [Clostridia bacterium]
MRIIAGEARSRTIETPKGLDTRPTLDRVRENLFNILSPRVPGARVLDLFAGSGALSLEALSRGAARAVMVDCQRAASQCQRQNAERLGMADRTRILLCDWKQAARTLAAAGERFDLIFLDPPYAMRGMEEVTAAMAGLIAPEGLLVTEHRAGSPYPVSEGWICVDERKYGYAGLTMYRREEQGA